MTVIFERLPDINTTRDLTKYPFASYGRFAVLRDGSYWFGELSSSHPQNTKIGWYWAISPCGNLVISSRGSINTEGVIADNFAILKWLIAELIRRRIIQNSKSIDISIDVSKQEGVP